MKTSSSLLLLLLSPSVASAQLRGTEQTLSPTYNVGRPPAVTPAQKDVTKTMMPKNKEDPKMKDDGGAPSPPAMAPTTPFPTEDSTPFPTFPVDGGDDTAPAPAAGPRPCAAKSSKAKSTKAGSKSAKSTKAGKSDYGYEDGYGSGKAEKGDYGDDYGDDYGKADKDTDGYGSGKADKGDYDSGDYGDDYAKSGKAFGGYSSKSEKSSSYYGADGYGAGKSSKMSMDLYDMMDAMDYDCLSGKSAKVGKGSYIFSKGAKYDYDSGYGSGKSGKAGFGKSSKADYDYDGGYGGKAAKLFKSKSSKGGYDAKAEKHGGSYSGSSKGAKSYGEYGSEDDGQHSDGYVRRMTEEAVAEVPVGAR